MRILKRIAQGLALILSVLLALILIRFAVIPEVGTAGPIEAAPPATPMPAEFSIVTYNVQARPWFDDSAYKFARMPKVLEPFDIVTFQEMFKDHEIMYAGLSHTTKLYHSGIKHPFKIVGSGLGTVSRFPVTGFDAMHFTTAGDFQNKPASKGMLLARARIGGMPVDIYTTHMEAGSDRKPEAMWSRREQAEEMVEFVRTHSPADHAVILLGDFNMRHSEPGKEDPEIAAGRVPEEFDNLSRPHIFDAVNAALGLKDLCKETQGHYFDGVDHILFRSGAQAVLTPLSWQHDGPEFYDEAKQPLSDHEPVIGRFRVAPPA